MHVVFLAVMLLCSTVSLTALQPKIWLIYSGLLSSITQTFTVAGAAAAPGTSGVDQTVVRLSPTALRTITGKHSPQPLTVRPVQDQAGSADNWGRYKEFSTTTGGYAGVFTFVLPTEVHPSTLTALALQTNFRGPSRGEQRWQWSLYDFAQRQWVQLGDNSGARNWVWTPFTFPVSGGLQRFLSATDHLKVRYQTGSTVDNSDLDALGIVVHTTGRHWRPTPGTSWQWQLQGTIDPSIDVQMYDIDLVTTPQQVIDQLHAAGRIVICYFSAGSWEQFRPDADQFPRVIRGKTLDGFADERWLDIRQLDILGPLMRARLELAVQKRCDGVEPDNVDGYANNTGFPLTAQQQLAYNIWLATEAHARGLSVGLKNDLDQVTALVPYFDWALNEQCFEFKECNVLLPFVQANKAVFGVEYQGDPGRFCPRANALEFSWLKKRLGLGVWRRDCQNIQ